MIDIDNHFGIPGLDIPSVVVDMWFVEVGRDIADMQSAATGKGPVGLGMNFAVQGFGRQEGIRPRPDLVSSDKKMFEPVGPLLRRVMLPSDIDLHYMS